MVRNVRWLYNKLGTEDFSAIGGGSVTGALSSLQSELDGKSPSSHNHNTSSLPVSSNQVNSANYIPTSAMLYSMAQRVEGIQTLIATAKRELDDPNKRYESKSLGTWSSVSDVDTFLSQYSHNTNYEGLSLGNYVTIQDGTYNVEWVIAGFDMECGQMAADNTIYDNGYGICLIPKTYVTSSTYIDTPSLDGGYLSSYIHSTILSSVSNSLKRILSGHLIDRNVLLCNRVRSTDSWPNGYTWTKSYATLLSYVQCIGGDISSLTTQDKYNTGEATYKLPVFNYEKCYVSSLMYYERGIRYYDRGYYCYYIYYPGSDNLGYRGYANAITNSLYVRPLIYIR